MPWQHLMHTAVVSIPSIVLIEQYGADNVTVILEWSKQPLVTYNISVTPDTVVQESSDNSRLRAQLTLAYNAMYSVKFVASLCGHNLTKAYEFLHGEHLYVNSSGYCCLSVH